MNNAGNKILFNSTTSFVALAGAAYVNAYVSRMNELKNGIMLYDDKGNDVGLSKAAAQSAVSQTANTRMFIAFQMVMVPGLLLGFMQKSSLMPRGFVMRSFT